MSFTVGIEYEGLAEISRGLRETNRDLARQLTGVLREVAEPIRREAEQLAAGRILNIGAAWPRMQTGVTQSVVYIVPREKGRGRDQRLRRPNLSGLLLDRAMKPALEHGSPQLAARTEQFVTGLLARNGI